MRSFSVGRHENSARRTSLLASMTLSRPVQTRFISPRSVGLRLEVSMMRRFAQFVLVGCFLAIPAVAQRGGGGGFHGGMAVVSVAEWADSVVGWGAIVGALSAQD